MNNDTLIARKRASHGRIKKIFSNVKAKVRPYGLALGMLGVPLVAGAVAGCIHLEGAPGQQACESKNTTDISRPVTGAKEYASGNKKLYSNGTKGACQQPDIATLVETDIATSASRVITENVGPVGNSDGPYVLVLSGPSVKKDGDTCSQAGLTNLMIYNTDTGIIGDIPVKATVAWLSGSAVAYEADNPYFAGHGNGGYDVHVYDFVTGNSGILAQGMRLVQEGMPFNGKAVYAYDNTGLYSVDVMTSKRTLQSADNTLVPYLAGDMLALHDKAKNIVTFSRTSDTALFSTLVAESWQSPRPVAVFGDYFVVVNPDMGVDVMDPKIMCSATIPFGELANGWTPPADLTGYVARLLPAGPDSFISEFSSPGSGRGFAALVGLK